MLKNALKFLAKDSAVYGLTGAVTKFFAIFTVPIITRVLTKGEYGSVNLVISYISVFMGFIVLGQDSAIARFFYEKKENEKYRQKVATIGLFLQLFATVIFSILFYFIGDTIGDLIFDKNRDLVFFWKIAMISLPGSMLILFSRNIFKWTFQKNKYLILTLGNAILNIALTIFLVVILKKGVWGIIISNVISVNLFALIGMIINFKYIKLREVFNLENKKLAIEMLKYGLPFTLVMVLSIALPTIDKSFLVRFVSRSTIADYSVAMRISSLLLMVVSSFQIAFEPYLFSIWKEKNSPDLIAKLFKIYFIVLSVFSVLGVVFGDFIIYIFASSKYENAIIYIPLLMIAVILEGFMLFSRIGIFWSKKTYYFLIVQIIGFIIILGANFLFTKPFGVIGAVFSLLVARFLMNFIYFRISHKFYPIRYEFNKIFLIFLFSLLVYAVTIYNFYSPTFLSYFFKYSLLLFFIFFAFSVGFSLSERKTFFADLKRLKNKYLGEKI